MSDPDWRTHGRPGGFGAAAGSATASDQADTRGPVVTFLGDRGSPAPIYRYVNYQYIGAYFFRTDVSHVSIQFL